MNVSMCLWLWMRDKLTAVLILHSLGTVAFHPLLWTSSRLCRCGDLKGKCAWRSAVVCGSLLQLFKCSDFLLYYRCTFPAAGLWVGIIVWKHKWPECVTGKRRRKVRTVINRAPDGSWRSRNWNVRFLCAPVTAGGNSQCWDLLLSGTERTD